MKLAFEIREICAKWFWRLLAAFFWLSILHAWTGAFPGDLGRICDFVFAKDWATYRIITYCIAFALYAFTSGFWNALGKVTYIFFFPISAPWLALWQVSKLSWTTVTLVGTSAAFLLSYRAWALAAVILPLSFYYITLKGGGLFTLPLMLVTAVSSLSIYVSIFIWTIRPLKFLEYAVEELLKAFRESIAKDEETYRIFSEAVPDKQKELAKLLQASLKSYDGGTALLQWFYELFSGHTFLTVCFLVAFTLAFFIVAFTFTIIFAGLEQLHPGSFRGAVTANVWDYIYASLMWLTTSSPDILIPLTRTSRFLVVLETLFGINLVTFLFACFSLAFGHSIDAGKSHVSRLITAVSGHISFLQQALKDPVVLEVVEIIARDDAAKKPTAPNTKV